MIRFFETVGVLVLEVPAELSELAPHPIKGRPRVTAVNPKALDLIK